MPPAPTAPWVDPTVSRLMITCPTWPVVLYANHGQTPVTFRSAAELRAATLPESGQQIELMQSNRNHYMEER